LDRKSGSPANLLPTAQTQTMLSPLSFFRRANTEKNGYKGSKGLQNIIGEMRAENLKQDDLFKKKSLSSNSLQNLEENLEFDIQKKTNVSPLGHLNSENKDQLLNDDESGISTPRKSSGDKSWFADKESRKSSFCSETLNLGDDQKNHVEKEKPLSMYNMETQTSQLMINSPTTSDSFVQNMDMSGSEHSSLNSPLPKESERSNPIYRKSKFYNKKDALRLPDDEDEEEKKYDELGKQLEEGDHNEMKYCSRRSMFPLTVIPVIKIERSQDEQVDTRQTEALISLKKEILKTKRLISLYEILKDQGKAITDQEIFQKSIIFYSISF